MRRVFIDCGVREGDAIAAFLGDENVGFGGYYRCLKPRPDARDYEFIGFESADFGGVEQTKRRFADVRFTIIEKLAWTHDGVEEFDSDGESSDCRILQVSRVEGKSPWRHPNPAAVVKKLPCVDLANFLNAEFGPEDYIVLKMDIEGAEYDVLQRMIVTGAISRVRELYVEYHWWGNTALRDEIHRCLLSRPGLYYRDDWP